jgi:hypothetical protein
MDDAVSAIKLRLEDVIDANYVRKTFSRDLRTISGLAFPLTGKAFYHSWIYIIMERIRSW